MVGAVGWWVQSCVGSENFQFRLKGLSLQKKVGMIKEGRLVLYCTYLRRWVGVQSCVE